MRRTAVFLIALAFAADANPVMDWYISEIQVAPDSLERVELHFYSGSQCPGDLSGARIITRAGTAVIDSGVVLDSTNYVVIDRTNTSGTFSLADDSDNVRLAIPPDTLNGQSVVYPGNPNRNHAHSWRPPAGLSCCLATWTEYWPPALDYVDVVTWYIDSTPTFGSANDGAAGGISGLIFDNNGHALPGATVTISAAQGEAQMVSAEQYYWPAGYYEEMPTGPGVFFVTAAKEGYLPGCYSDSIRLNTNERQYYINIYLYPLGLAEQAVASGRACPCISWYRDRLLIVCDRECPARVRVVDEVGRVVWRQTVELRTGTNGVVLNAQLDPGVYFASCRLGERTLKTKFVLY
jgi:hypothetical protein